MARIRSPNYPQISLGAAIERARMIYRTEKQNRIDREVAVKLMGFGGYNGASAGVLSAVLKYGLLEPVGDGEFRISDLAQRLIKPHDDAEYGEAALEAAFKPPLFAELRERWPDGAFSEHSLRTYLDRRGFAESALDNAVRSYTDSLDLVQKFSVRDGVQSESELEVADLQSSVLTSSPSPTPAPPPKSSLPANVLGPTLNIVPTPTGYTIHLAGVVATQGQVDDMITMLSALKPSLATTLSSDLLDFPR